MQGELARGPRAANRRARYLTCGPAARWEPRRLQTERPEPTTAAPSWLLLGVRTRPLPSPAQHPGAKPIASGLSSLFSQLSGSARGLHRDPLSPCHRRLPTQCCRVADRPPSPMSSSPHSSLSEPRGFLQPLRFHVLLDPAFKAPHKGRCHQLSFSSHPPLLL